MDFRDDDLFQPPEADAEAPGRTIGAWRLESELGRGGMGRVWLARHELLGTHAAVKVLHRDLAAYPEHRQRFIDEARAGAVLRHPNVVQVFDCFVLPDGRPAFAMERLDGRDLEQVAGSAPMEPGRARAFLLQLASALAEVHYRGLVHRDVKPGNAMVVRTRDGDEVVKLLDFGIARRSLLEAGLTSPGLAMGTPHYMAPEQALGAPVDFRSDVYALGVLAFRLLEGRVPFDGPLQEVLVQQVHAEPPPMAHGSPALQAIVRRAMAKKPADRFDTAGVFARALREAGEAEKPLVHVTSTPGRLDLGLSSAEQLRDLVRHAATRRRVFLPTTERPSTERVEVRATAPGADAVTFAARVLLATDDRDRLLLGAAPGLALELEPQPVVAPKPELTPHPSAPPPAPPRIVAPVPANGKRPRAERFRRRFPVGFGPSEASIHTGFTTNVSSNGIGVTTQHPMAVGSRVFLAFAHVPDGPRVMGTVAWSKAPAIRGGNGAMGVRVERADESYFRLLLEVSQGAGAAAKAGPVIAPPRAQVMVVEDNRDVRTLLADAFESEGYDVLPCSDGGLAIAAMERLRRPSAVVLDLMMPLTSGWKFLDAMRASPEHRDIPVVVLSAHPDAGKLPGTHFVPKPFELNAVTSLVGRLVSA